MCTVRAGVAAGIKAHAARSADGRGRIGAGEPNAHGRQAVHIWGLECRVPCTAEVIETQLVVHDK